MFNSDISQLITPQMGSVVVLLMVMSETEVRNG